MATSSEILLIQRIIANNSTDSSSSESDDSSSGLTSDSEQNTHHKIKNFLETINKYGDDDFKKHFRLSQRTCKILIESYRSSDLCPNHNHGGKEKIGAETEIYVFVWYVANTITYRQLGNLFGICNTTAWAIVRRVSSWIVSIANNYIKWPRTQHEVQKITSSFEDMKGISGVLGAIDGTHIQIKAPSINRHLYCNRKKYYSILMQAVVDSKKKFIDVYCGEPGSLHDSRVLRRSLLNRKATDEYEASFPNNTFLLGDSAYPSKSWLVTPYKDDGNLTQINRKFNYLHSSTRMLVENAFGLLKTRFRRLLHFTEHSDLKTAVNLTIASCVLHNICIDEKDDWDDEDGSTGDIELNNLESEEARPSTQRLDDRRQLVVNNLIAKGLL